MPGRRGRKRRRPQRADSSNLSKKREFVFVCGRQEPPPGQLPSVPDNSHQQVALVEEEEEMDEVPTSTLLDHLSQILPPELLASLQTDPPYPWLTRGVSIFSSLSLDPPSFCVSRFSLSLITGASLSNLLSRVCLGDPDFLPRLTLYSLPFPDDSVLEIWVRDGQSVYLRLTSSTPLTKWTSYLRSSAVYQTQLVLNLKEEERGRGEERGGKRDCAIRNSDSGLGDCDSGEVELDLASAGSLGEELASLTERETQCVGVEVGGCVDGLQGGVSGGEGSVVMGEGEGSGRGGRCEGGGVCVEVWVGGEVCEARDPNALSPGGSSARLAELVEAFHPTPPVEVVHHSTPGSGPGLSIAARIDQFYEDVKRRRRELYGATEPEYDTSSIAGLTAELRGYQRRAVQWMLDRERGVEGNNSRSTLLHPLWRELSAPRGSLYFNPHTGRLTSERYCPTPPPLGGILADEMGLGKTVEVLALLMAHRAPSPSPSPHSSHAGRESEVPGSVLPVPPVTSPSKTTSRGPHIPPSSSSLTEASCPGARGTGGAVQSVRRGATSETGEDGRELVRCERCEMWLDCVRFQSSRHSSFVCIRCLLEEPLSSRATLIISPQSILQQWRQEIEKHTSPGSLSVLHYEGVKYGFVSPYDLADCDVVLVSYETLSRELNYAKSHEVSRVLRHRKRYSAAPSPLPAVNWWRVCLDEAQMVESAATKPAEMCLRLKTHHRWCVTGTPIQRDLNDLYGLVLFLDVEPYSQSRWYRQLIAWPYLQGHHDPLVYLFSSLMWRNTKQNVAHELQLPEHTEKTHFLTFSLVEKFFYRKQREMCKTEASKVLSRLSDNYTLSSLTQDTVQKIMAPLHSLRRACCHPQMVRRGGYLPTSQNKKSLTMAQLLEKLIAQAKVEAREGLRKSILSLNGLAGLSILNGEWRKARETYEQAITMWGEYKEKEVDCDRLQKIHTFVNLAWLVEQGHCSPQDLSGPWQNIHSLREKARELQTQFLGKAEGQVRAAAVAVVACKTATRDSWDHRESKRESRKEDPSARRSVASSSGNKDRDRLNEEREDVPLNQDKAQPGNQDTPRPLQDSSHSPNQDTTSDQERCGGSSENCPIEIWVKEDDASVLQLVGWVGVAAQWVKRGRWLEAVDQLIKTVNSHLLDSSHLSLGQAGGGRQISDLSSIQYILSLHLHQLQEARALSLRTLHSLLSPPTQRQVEQAYHCHLALNRDQKRGEGAMGLLSCNFCRAESVLVQYGSQLFCQYFSSNSMGLEHGEGSRGAHAFEKIVRSFLGFLRHRCAPPEVLDAGKTLVEFIEAIKKEYDALRTLWQSLGERVSQFDELRLATSCMRYMTPSEVADGTADLSAVHPHLLLAKREEFETERTLARNELTRSLGQIMYLNNLAKTPVSESDCGSCPICTRLLGKEIEEWGMLPCGHPLCMECVLEMSQRACSWQSRGVARLSCPLCRFSFLSTEINAIRPFEHEDMGNMSTKMRGVVRTLQAIKSESATAKTLVFSSWVETLSLVSASLTEHSIAHSFLKTSRSFQDNLSEFKTSEDINVLLLPLHSGSKGLNIVEATHVVLVEPGLNVGAELQAIGRVHRMGQTLPTTVHRLVIQDSVEERIHSLLSSSLTNNKFHTQREGESTLTLRELETLFS